MGIAPPLGICTGVVEPGVAFGGFGPASAFAWRGSCVGGCGARPMCAEDYPRPECSGCMRARHGVTNVLTSPWRPAVHALGADFEPRGSVLAPVPTAVSRPAVLRPAVEVSPHDPSLPAGVRRLALLRPGTRVTLAVAADAEGAVTASLAVRAPGVGFAVYTRGEGGAWRFSSGAVLAPRPPWRLPARPHLMRANVGRFTAAMLGEVYDPRPVLDVAPPAPTPTAKCPTCAAEVRVTQAGAIYANHRCATKTIEGRS